MLERMSAILRRNLGGLPRGRGGVDATQARAFCGRGGRCAMQDSARTPTGGGVCGPARLAIGHIAHPAVPRRRARHTRPRTVSLCLGTLGGDQASGPLVWSGEAGPGRMCAAGGRGCGAHVAPPHFHEQPPRARLLGPDRGAPDEIVGDPHLDTRLGATGPPSWLSSPVRPGGAGGGAGKQACGKQPPGARHCRSACRGWRHW